MIFPNFCVYIIGYIMFYVVFADTQDIKTDQHVKKSFINLLKNIIKINEKRMEVLKKLTELDDYDMIQNMMLSDTDDDDNGALRDISKPNLIFALLKVMHANGKFGQTRKTNDQSNQADKVQFLSVDMNYTSNIDPNLKKNHHEHTFYNNNKIMKEDRSEDDEIPRSKEVLNVESVDLSKIESSKENNEGNKLNVEVTDDENKIAVTVAGMKVNISVEDIRRSWMDSCSKKASKVCRDACINAHRNFCRIYSCSRRAKTRFKKECKISCKSKFVKSRYSDVE